MSAAIVCFSCRTKSEEPIERLESTECANSIVRAPAEMFPSNPHLAGKEHNRALSFLVEKFESKEDLIFDEIFEVWLDYANCRMTEYGNPKPTEEDINVYYECFKQLNTFCKTQFAGDAIISYIEYLAELGLISKDFSEYSLNSFSDIDFEKNNPCQIKESMEKRISLLDTTDEMLAHNMIEISEYSSVYWNEYFTSKASPKDEDKEKEEDSKEQKDEEDAKELKRKSENVRDLCATCVDVVAAAGAASTGAGALASGIVGAFGSFIFKEAMGW